MSLEHENKDRFFAAIDLGSNACRLHIGKITKNGYVVIKSNSKMVSLARMINENSRQLSYLSQLRAIKILSQQIKIIKQYNPEFVRYVTTAACRLASNGDEFIKKVKIETGIDLEIITPHEEARLALMGCEKNIKHFVKKVMIIDVGGGSTEIIYAHRDQTNPNYYSNNFKMIDYRSIPDGMLTLKDTYGPHINNIFFEIAKKINISLKNFITKNNIENMIKRNECKIFCCSSSSNLLNQANVLTCDDKKIKKFGPINTECLDRLQDVFNNKQKPCNGLFVAGTAILKGILDSAGAQKAYMTNKGVKDGLLQDIYNTKLKKQNSNSQNIVYNNSLKEKIIT